jgi:mono/diheme cytochrome c family protein
LGGDRDKQALRGYSLQGWFAPDITPDRRTGLWNWSETDIAEYLRKGHNRFAAASGPMAEEVADSSSKMSDGDLRAIAAYLKDEPAENNTVGTPLSPQDPVMAAGAAIYADLCSACHEMSGRGVPYLIPDLAASAAVASREPTTLLRVVLQGADTVATKDEPTAPQMPSYGWQLTDEQIAAVGTYLRNSWGHAASAISAHDVSSARASLNPKSE